MLVVPGQLAGKPLASAVRILRVRAVVRIANLRLRIAHADEKLGEGLHEQVNPNDAAVHENDTRRGRGSERRTHVRLADPVRIEGENARFGRCVELSRLGTRGDLYEPEGRHISRRTFARRGCAAPQNDYGKTQQDDRAKKKPPAHPGRFFAAVQGLGAPSARVDRHPRSPFLGELEIR